MHDVEIINSTAAFKTAEVRDLVWVMLSPGLLKTPAGDVRLVSDEWCQKTFSTHEADLRELDENPSSLLRYISALKSHRLGFYFERLVAFWLEHILQSNPFKKNVAVFQEVKNSGRRTMGEFDFLFGQKNPLRFTHWETTVKFYLYHESVGDGFRWLGPAGQDRFDIKLERIFEHQLNLAETPEGHSAVEHISVLPVYAEAFIKGYLFYPVIQSDSTLVSQSCSAGYLSIDVSPTHLRGWWLRYGEVIFPKRFVDSRWRVLPKLRWLSAARCIDAELDTLLDDAGIEKYCVHHFKKDNFPLLLAEMQRGLGGWVEVSRGFVVSPAWPAVINNR